MSQVYGLLWKHGSGRLDELLRMGAGGSGYGSSVQPEKSSSAQAQEMPQINGRMGWGPSWRWASWVLQWDGEIYDRAPMLERLNLPPDTEDPFLFLKGWQTGGLDFLQSINGPFALALWELEEQTWLLIRGRQGLRPVFWYESQEGIAFAQDLQILFRCPWVRCEPNWPRIPEYLVFDHTAGGETLYSGVKELLPGEILRHSFSEAQTTQRHFGHALLAPNSTFEDQDLSQRTETMLQDAVDKLGARGREENRAVFLSGGVDSALLGRALSMQDPMIPCLTVTCPGYKYDESAFARSVRSDLNLPGVEIPLEPAPFAAGWLESIEKLLYPLTSTNQVPWWLLCREAKRQGCSVVFAGEGADGWLAGGLYDDELETIRRSWQVDSEKVASLVVCCKTHILNDPRLVENILRVPLDLERRRDMWTDIRQGNEDRSIEDLTLLYHVRTTGHRLLTRADLVATCHGIDLRLPYLEDEWLRWSLSIPFSVRNPDGVRKWPLKVLCAQQWGEEFAYRKKIGFPFPLRTWIQTGENRNLKSWVQMLTDKTARKRDLYRSEILEHEVTLRLTGKIRPADWLLWSLVNLELWLRTLEGMALH
jgi:asparagine synthase (glutamine-hydrolysing)